MKRWFLANCAFETDAEVILIDYKKFKEEFLQNQDFNIFIKSLIKKIKFLQNFIDYNVSLNSMEKKLQNFYMKMRKLKTLKQVKIAQILNITQKLFQDS